MGAGAEFRDFGNAFAAASRGRFKSKGERQLEAIQLEEAKLRLDALRRAAADYPEDREIQKQKDALELEYARMRNDAAKKSIKEEGDTKPSGDPDYKPSGDAGSGIGPGSSMDAPGPFLGGGGNDDLMNQPGEASKSYLAPVTGTFANKNSNRYLAARKGGKRLHSGVDLNAANGSPVVAPISGQVLSVGNDPGGYDHYVVFMGNDGYIQRIAMHGPATVKRGDTLNAGDQVGVVGRGHVHWEIIAPNSGAYKALARGERASTQSHRGSYPTVDLSGFFGLQYGTNIVAGKPLGGGGGPAVAGIPGRGRPGLPGGAGGDTLESVSDWNRRNDPEHPGSLINRVINADGHIDEHMGQPPWDPLVQPGKTAVAIPTPWGGGVDETGGPNDFARATGRTGQAALELPSQVRIGGVAPTSVGARDYTANPLIPRPNPRRGNGSAPASGYTNEGGSAGSRYGGRGLTKLSAGDRQAVLDVSSQLGIAPSYLLSVIGYETIGTYNPDITSPTGYRGLIQFGPNEQKKFGVKPGMSFSEQLRGPVVDYLQSRGLKPGMGLPELYSIINAGSLRKDGTPRWGAHDANGDLRYHLQRIASDYAPGAMAWLGGTQLDTTSAVTYKGEVVPDPRRRPDTGLPSENVTSAIPPRSPYAPAGWGASPASPLTPAGPTADPATRPSIAPVAFNQGGAFAATGRTGSFQNSLELPRIGMAKGGVVPSNSDIARATGRTGQLAMELPSDAPVSSSVEDRRGQPPVPPPHDYNSDYSPGDGLDTQRGPDTEFSPGGQDPGVDDGYDPFGSVIDAGHHAVRKAVEGEFGITPASPDDIIGGSGTDVTVYGGGAGGDVVDDGSGGDTGGDTAPAPDTDVTGEPVTAAGEGAIPTPGLKLDALPAPKKTDPDIAAYIADQEEKIDPDHNMPATQRHLYALGLIYKHFRDTKHNPVAAERVAREILTYWSQQYNMYQAVAEEAIASGNLDDGVKAAIKAWNFIPDNREISVDKDHHGFKVTYTDNAGKTIVEQTLSPQEIAGKILGMNPKTFYDQIVAAAGGHLPSKAFSAALEKLDRTGKMSPEDRATVRDPGELDYLIKHQQALQKTSASEDTADKAQADADRRKASADIQKAYAKNGTLPTPDQLAAADDHTQTIFQPLLDKADKATKATEKSKSMQEAFTEWDNTHSISNATAAKIAAIDGGQDALDKYIKEKTAAADEARKQAEAARAKAGEDRAVADDARKAALPPGGLPNSQELGDAGIKEAADATIAGIEGAVPERKVPVLTLPAQRSVNDVITNVWTWNRERGFTSNQVADFIGQYLQVANPDTRFGHQDDPNNGPNTTVVDVITGDTWRMPKSVLSRLDQLNGVVAARNTADAAHKTELDAPPPPAPPTRTPDPYTNPSVTSRLPPPEARPSTAGPAIAPSVPFNPDPMHRRMPPRPAGP